MSASDEIIRLYETHGRRPHHDDGMTHAEHALQTAHRAEVEGAPAPLIVAALLHNVGHILRDPSDRGEDRHEQVGADWLATYFGPEITEPVRLHVAAKRYLCAIEPAFGATLSTSGLRNLEQQGGPMTAAEVIRFESNPFHREAIWLRRCDETARVVKLAVPDFEHHRARLDEAARKAACGS